MSWLDLTFIIVVIAGGLLGMRIGLMGTAFTVLAVISGILVIGYITDDVATWFAQYMSNDTLTAVLGYMMTILLFGALAVTGRVFLGKYAYAQFLGWADRVAGLALGLVASAAISISAISSVVDRAYGPGIPSDAAQETLLDKTVQATDAREKLAESLSQSAIVPKLTGMIDSFLGPLHLPGL